MVSCVCLKLTGRVEETLDLPKVNWIGVNDQQHVSYRKTCRPCSNRAGGLHAASCRVVVMSEKLMQRVTLAEMVVEKVETEDRGRKAPRRPFATDDHRHSNFTS